MIRMTKESAPRQAAAPHGADEEVVSLNGVVLEAVDEVHEPRGRGIASAGRRRPVAVRRGEATFGHAARDSHPWPVIEGHIHRRVEGPGIDDTLQLLLI